MYESSQNLVVSNSGLVINPKWPWLACSPDGLLEQKAVEVKCPYTFKDINVYDACSEKDFFMKLENDEPKLKENHAYFHQCQGVMALTEMEEIDFIVYMNDSIYVQTIRFDNEQWYTQTLPALTKFYFEFISEKIFECK